MKFLDLLVEGFKAIACLWLTVHLFKKWSDALPAWAWAYIGTLVIIAAIFHLAWRQW